MSNTPEKTPEQLSKETQDRINLARASAAKQAGEAPTLTKEAAEDLEAVVRRILEEKHPTKKPPQEPNWATITEAEALNPESSVYIPIIEHEVPSYLDVKLADPEYVVVWVNRDQRRISEMLATGYEFLKPEHVSKSFVLPLKFDSEKMYTYADVVAMRVHKRIKLGKARKYVEMSTGQLKGAAARQRAISRLENDVISNDAGLDRAFSKGELSFF
jgi:hypothetical protein